MLTLALRQTSKLIVGEDSTLLGGGLIKTIDSVEAYWARLIRVDVKCSFRFVRD